MTSRADIHHSSLRQANGEGGLHQTDSGAGNLPWGSVCPLLPAQRETPCGVGSRQEGEREHRLSLTWNRLVAASPKRISSRVGQMMRVAGRPWRCARVDEEQPMQQRVKDVKEAVRGTTCWLEVDGFLVEHLDDIEGHDMNTPLVANLALAWANQLMTLLVQNSNNLTGMALTMAASQAASARACPQLTILWIKAFGSFVLTKIFLTNLTIVKVIFRKEGSFWLQSIFENLGWLIK